MTRFFANENLSLPVVKALRRLGRDVLTIPETGHAGAAVRNDEVLAFATVEVGANLARCRIDPTASESVPYVIAAVQSRRFPDEHSFCSERQSFGATTRRDLDMGAIAEAFAAYAQLLIDQTDGSEGQLKKAFAISQTCFNLALLPKDSRDQVISELRSSLKMDDEEFDDFLRSIILPMIQRHQEMFPQMHRRGPTNFSQGGPSTAGPSLGARPMTATRPITVARSEACPRTDPYEPCPCNSGRKYKFCCGKKVR